MSLSETGVNVKGNYHSCLLLLVVFWMYIRRQSRLIALISLTTLTRLQTLEVQYSRWCYDETINPTLIGWKLETITAASIRQNYLRGNKPVALRVPVASFFLFKWRQKKKNPISTQVLNLRHGKTQRATSSSDTWWRPTSPDEFHHPPADYTLAAPKQS